VTPVRVRVLANRVEGRPDRLIRRTYLLAIRRARTSIDITSAYFLPGPLFLRALREAVKRGVTVRVLVPMVCDVWLAGLAMEGMIGKLLRDGIQVFAYTAAVLHAKTAVLDDRFVLIGSHNLDTFSWRFNLEANVLVDDRAFAGDLVASFERDLASSVRLDLQGLRARPWFARLLAWAASLLRGFL
jgi:cardiolipin synthase